MKHLTAGKKKSYFKKGQFSRSGWKKMHDADVRATERKK